MNTNPRRAQRVRIFTTVLFLVHEHQVGRQINDARDPGVFRAADLFDGVNSVCGMDAEFRPRHKIGSGTEVEYELRQGRTEGDETHGGDFTPFRLWTNVAADDRIRPRRQRYR